MNLKIRAQDLGQATEQALRQDILDVRSFLPAVAEVVAAAIDENFERSGRWDGRGTDLFSGGNTQWKKLSPSTVEQRKYKGYFPINILRQTGQLAASISTSVSGTSITISANKVYAAIHQYGGTIESTTRISARMRKFFWAKYYSTGEEKFKWMALTKKQTIERRITIPARPFITLTPADLDEVRDTIVDSIITKYRS